MTIEEGAGMTMEEGAGMTMEEGAGMTGLALLAGVDVGLSDTHASEGGQPQGLSLRVDRKVLCAC